MNRPNMIGSKLKLWNVPSFSLVSISDANQQAIDSAATGYDVYPHAYTATVSSEKDERVVHSLGSNWALQANQKVAFGLFMLPFLSGSQLQRSVLFNVQGSLKFFGSNDTTGAIQAYPFIGQTVNATVTSSVAAASNQTSRWIKLPTKGVIRQTTATSYQDLFVNEDIILQYNSSNTNPLVFGFAIENNSAGALTVISPIMWLNIHKYIQDLDVFADVGR